MSEAKFTRIEGTYTPPPAPAPSTATYAPGGPPKAPPPAPEPTAAPSHAPSDELTVVLPDGRSVLLKRPEVACQFLVYRILGGAFPDGKVMPAANVTVKALMYVKSIDAQQVSRPYDHVQAQALMNTLGDEGTEIVAGAYLQHFLLQQDGLPLSGR